MKQIRRGGGNYTGKSGS